MELGYAIKHDILIRRSANMGFIVKIGCGEFVAMDLHNLLDQLGMYLESPEQWEKEYSEKCDGGEAPDREAITQDAQPEGHITRSDNVERSA